MENDHDVIKEIERIIGKSIPIIEDIFVGFGVVYRDNKVVALTFRDLKLESYPHVISELNELEVFDLRESQIKNLPDSIGNLRSLKRLLLTGSDIEHLPISIGNLKKLTLLEASNMKLNSLPDSIGDLKVLEKLYLNINNLNCLPDTLGNLRSLKELELRKCNLTSLPISIGNLEKLEKLDLRENYLSNLPNSIAGMKSLKKIELDKNNLVQLPEDIKFLENLEYINLNNNQIIKISDSLGENKNLRNLNLERNKITTIPDLSLSSSMQKIRLTGNPLRLDENNRDIFNQIKNKKIGFECEPIKYLYFQGVEESEINLIKSFLSINNKLRIHIVWGDMWSSRDNRNLLKVQYLDGHVIELRCQSSLLKNIPDSIGDFAKLQRLNLRGNIIESIPVSFGNLKELETLDLSSNKLESLPESFSNLIKIKQLNLSDNKFTEIPTLLWSLTQLSELNLTDNPFNSDDSIISKKIPELILKHLRKKATIKVFISHAVQDFDTYRLQELANYLRKQKEISEVFVCEENLTGNIDEWMLETVPKSQLLLFIATSKSIFDSPDCRNELELAKKFSIPSVPIKGFDVDWPDLGKLGVARELGKDFNLNNFDEFCKDLYGYIYTFKREMDLMSEKKRHKGFYNIYEQFQITIKELEDRIKLIENRLLGKIEALEKQIKK